MVDFERLQLPLSSPPLFSYLLYSIIIYNYLLSKKIDHKYHNLTSNYIPIDSHRIFYAVSRLLYFEIVNIFCFVVARFKMISLLKGRLL
ncbi:hypothetical protein EMIT0P294_90016 [Pseudomonas sp. IT-P294]